MALLHTDDFPNLYYRKTGAGPAVILIHGFPENGDLWHNIWPSLSVNSTVITLDVPGSGQSAFKEGDSPSIASLAESINNIMEEERLKEAVIVGHSMGGYIALAFAVAYPDKVKGISLVHSHATADSDEKKKLRQRSIDIIENGGKDAFIRQMVPNLFSPVFKKQNADIVEIQVARGASLKMESMVAFYKAMANRPDLLTLLIQANFPKQWIIGKDDGTMPYEDVLKQSHISNANFVSVYDDCGHMSMLECPDKLATDLNKFVAYCYSD